MNIEGYILDIVVNARFLTQSVTGVQRFAIEISRQLKKMLPNVVFVAPQNILHKEIAAELAAITFGSQRGHLWEQFDLPLYLKKNGSPLLINLANTAPLLYKKQFVTVHDVAFRINPSWFSWPFRTYYNFLIPLVAQKALQVITVSNSAKQDIVSHLSIPPDNIEVINNAVSPTFTLPNPERRVDPLNYFLAVSSLDPRKNFISLINAFNLFDDKTFKLVIIGGGNTNFKNTELQSLLINNSSIELRGYVSDEELLTLYQEAYAFIYPSLYEGFGIPNIEAMRIGCPVITSDIAVLHEICRDAALYVNPLDPVDIAAKMQQLTTDKELRSKLIAYGYNRSAKYSWKTSAEKLAGIIKHKLSIL